MGLLIDPMIDLFISSDLETIIKSPLINRGTFIRTKIIDKIVEHHISRGNVVVSLGAGYDTRFYRLNVQSEYIEVDLPQVIRKKKKFLSNQTRLPKFVSLDLNEGFGQLRSLNLSSVLFVAECCLMYLEEDQCEQLIEWMSSIPNSSLMTFDPMIGNDPFSRMFLNNLKVGTITTFFIKSHCFLG